MGSADFSFILFNSFMCLHFFQADTPSADDRILFQQEFELEAPKMVNAAAGLDLRFPALD